MKRACAAAGAALTVLLWAGSAWATTEDEWQAKCPACGETFQTRSPGNYSTSGSEWDGRPICIGVDVQEYQLHACPKCHFAGPAWSFGKGGPTAEQLPAIRTALAAANRRLPAGELWPLEKAQAAEACLIAAKARPEALCWLYTIAAWLADDAGEDAMAKEYRGKAIRAELAEAQLPAKLAEDCTAVVDAALAGRNRQAAQLYKTIAQQIDAELAADEARRVTADRRNPAGTTRPTTEEGSESDEEKAAPLTPAERSAMERTGALGLVVHMVRLYAVRAEMTDLGPEKAADLARSNPHGFHQNQYIHLFGIRKDPVVIQAITEFTCPPLGPARRPGKTPESDSDGYSDRAPGHLRDLWDQLRRKQEFGPDVAGNLPDAPATHVSRPAPLPVKLALCQAAGKVPLPGIEEAMQRWSASQNTTLADAARKSLAATSRPAVK